VTRSIASAGTISQIRVLYLHPASQHAAPRANQVGESIDSFVKAIELGIVKLRELQEQSQHSISLKLYDAKPTWRIIRFDDTMFVSTYVPGKEGQSSQMLKLVPHDDGVLFAAFSLVFEEMYLSAIEDERR